MGIHTGDSITVAPAMTLSDTTFQRMRDMAIHMMNSIGAFAGGCNVQFAVSPDEKEDIIAIEINPRVSRSSALASKATGYPIAKIDAKLAIGVPSGSDRGGGERGGQAVRVVHVHRADGSFVRYRSDHDREARHGALEQRAAHDGLEDEGGRGVVVPGRKHWIAVRAYVEEEARRALQIDHRTR